MAGLDDLIQRLTDNIADMGETERRFGRTRDELIERRSNAIANRAKEAPGSQGPRWYDLLDPKDGQIVTFSEGGKKYPIKWVGGHARLMDNGNEVSPTPTGFNRWYIDGVRVKDLYAAARTEMEADHGSDTTKG